MRAFDVTTSLIASITRAGTGMQVGVLGRRPARPLELFEFEGCPFCRKVREALSILDLEANIYPCPQAGPRYRPYVVSHGGKAQFPFLRDPNTATEMYESDAIVRYLFLTYGETDAPWALATPLLTDLNSTLASLPRITRGRSYRQSREPETPLELYSFEASPYSRLVRETLCELEIPYLLHNVAKGSPGRRRFLERSKKVMVPWLVDPNSGVEMFESAEICDYLEETYAV
ncbi:MAG: glutathione S-transferase [Hyphomicrobiaceae bacterium]|jgi:glutathione S-transferase